MSIHLIVMAKAPVAGFAKTRLVPPLSHAQAAGLADAMLCDMLDRPWPGVVRCLCTSGESDRFVAAAAAGWRCSKQAEGDLGRRLDAASRAAFADGATAVVFLGTDAPDLPAACFAALLEALDAGFDVVLGPATDGGYYTIATRSHEAALFADMPWSQPSLCEETVACVQRLGLRLHLLPAWSDLDEVSDLRALLRRAEEAAAVAPRTVAAARAVEGL